MKRILVKVSVMLWMPSIIAFIAAYFKFITTAQMLIIYLIIAILQMSLLFYAMHSFIKMIKSGGISTIPIINQEAKAIIPKGKCDNTFIKANTGIFSKFIIPTNPHHNSIFRIKFVVFTELQEKLKFSIMRTCRSDNCEQEINDIKPTKESSYMFDIAVDPREKLNFKFNKDVTLQSFTVDELYIP